MAQGQDMVVEVEREQPFEMHELFFSATDRRGVISAGNDVFVRVSGHDVDELIGRPHNLIRHPDMPMGVFRLLWDHLEADQPVMAYVKNRAKDGSYYWVAAVARPVENGYLSVRLKPSTPVFDTVRALYVEMSAIEADTRDQGRSAAMDASQRFLLDQLARLGFDGYDSFMRAALAAEVMARRTELRRGHRSSSRSAGGSVLAHRLDSLIDELASYEQIGRELSTASEVLVDIAEEGNLLALNAVFASRRLSSGGETLAAVSNALQDTFPVMARDAREVVDHIATARTCLDTAAFAISLAVLQHDMAAFFDGDRYGQDDDRHAQQGRLLHRCLDADVAAMGASVEAMIASVKRTAAAATVLENGLVVLATIERSGQIEAARCGEAHALRALLDQVRDRVAVALAQARLIRRLAGDIDARRS